VGFVADKVALGQVFSEYFGFPFFFFFLYGAAAHIGPWPHLYEVP
jgi:hypothetical protein